MRRWWLALVWVVSCGGAPQVRATANELEDARTGIVLSDQTRTEASDASCKEMVDNSGSEHIVCVDRQMKARSPAFSELERLFALDQPIPADVWRSVRESSGATQALLFRPESVSSSHEVTKELKGSSGGLVGGGVLLATSAIVSGIVAAKTIHEVPVSNTEVSYTVSASLVDMRSGRLLKVGVHTRSDSRKVERNQGFAEPPPVAPLLEKIMLELGEEVLSD